MRNLCHWLCQAGLTLEPILADVPAFQERLVNLWRWYWEGFFRDEVEALRPHWQASLRHKAAILSRTEGRPCSNTSPARPSFRRRCRPTTP